MKEVKKTMTGQSTGTIIDKDAKNPVFVIVRIFHFPDFSVSHVPLGHVASAEEGEEVLSRLSTDLKIYDAVRLLGISKIEHVVATLAELDHKPRLVRPDIRELLES